MTLDDECDLDKLIDALLAELLTEIEESFANHDKFVELYGP